MVVRREGIGFGLALGCDRFGEGFDWEVWVESFLLVE